MSKFILAGAAIVAINTADTAAAQSADWTGGYIGGRVGYAAGLDDNDERILFDTDLDGTFGDTVNTAAGADAFSPGFCGGSPESAVAADGCDKDNKGIDYGIFAGYDYDFGAIVVGALVEYGRSKVEDAVTAFSTTPANYAFNRELKGTFGLRGRLGIDAGGFMPYVTAGVVRAKIKDSFVTSNAVNAFALNQRSHRETGYRLGGGVEAMVGPVALGLLYLRTNVKDEDARVAVTQGTAGPTNPFILVNPSGTAFRRSEDRFKTHALSLTASYRFGGLAAAPPPPPPPTPPPVPVAPATQTCPDGSVILTTDACPAPPPPPPPPIAAPERG
ncbi:MAG: Membrane protein [uncultured Sphingomonas sp.]|uniref:Membrane protein n=1 Tax=uncultured Sphingomonas sp. TaxID=158754 RepID=A0A6J4TEA9_9SPHN|nr:outer membrane beta-barrel protein [uncultured Sphingomonas sp.]CAA9521515.1 MAG: Membrane protein [uncultured Sphingomonas sp.]